MLPLSVIVLTYNEEANVAQCLESLRDWAAQVIIVDSFSQDNTVEIAKALGAEIYQHQFLDYADQRNWALRELPVRNDWIMFLDADEYPTTDLKQELSRRLPISENVDAFYLKRRLHFMGRWIRYGGYYPTWLLRIFRKGTAHATRPVNEHIQVEGRLAYLEHDIVDNNLKPLSSWIDKHNKYSDSEALLLSQESRSPAGSSLSWKSLLSKNPASRRAFMRQIYFSYLPPIFRCLLQFFYRYLCRGGFRDGAAGFLFHFLQGLWHFLLIDAKYLEQTRAWRNHPANSSGTARLN